MKRSPDHAAFAEEPTPEVADTGAVENELAESAVDTTLIDELLRLSPAERLRQNDRAARLVVELQSAFSHHGRCHSPET